MTTAKKSTKPVVKKTARKTTKKRAPRKVNLSFEDAREYIRSQNIQSVSEYRKWFDLKQPKNLPAYPHRAYEKQWEGWNDFLGVSNYFGEGRKHDWVSYEEGVMRAHRFKLNSAQEWTDFVKDVGDEWPDDLPKRPDLVYKEWVSWPAWLGYTTESRVRAKQSIIEKKLGIIYFYQDRHLNSPSNVYQVSVETQGLAILKERATKRNLYIAKAYWFDKDKEDQIMNIINATSSPWRGSPSEKIFPHIYDTFYEISMILREVRA